MGFFATFWTWLGAQLSAYVGDNTARVAAIIEPAVVTSATIYVMIWGYLHLLGRIEEPFSAGLRRIILLAVIFGVALRLWLYNSLLVDTFYNAPTQFAAAIVGATDPVHTIDDIWDRGGSVADFLWHRGAWSFADFGFYLGGAIVWLLVGFLCVYTLFLFSLSSIALSVLLAVGPLFVVMLLFERTQRLFDSWLAQLANYALITILATMVAALLLRVVDAYANQTAAKGSAILTVDALNMLLVVALVLLVMRQVMPIAASLSSGVALSSFGVVSRMLSSPLRLVRR